MNRRHAIRTAALSMAMVASVILPGALGAGAAGGGGTAYSLSRGTMAPPAACKSVPKVYVYTAKKSKLANFYPKSVKVKVSTTASLCITNVTTATQTVTVSGSPLATIPTKGTADIVCNRPNSATFGLTSNPKAALAVTCTQ